MTPLDKSVTDLLDQVGAKLLRDKKHLVYEMPNGQKVTLSKTTKNFSNVENSLHEIRRAAGLVNDPKPTTVKVRRPPKPGRHEIPVKSLKRDLREALVAKSTLEKALAEWKLACGERDERISLSDEAYRQLNAGMNYQIVRANDLQYRLKMATVAKDHLVGLRLECWWCRLVDKWKMFIDRKRDWEKRSGQNPT